jgi:hypothetical protein
MKSEAVDSAIVRVSRTTGGSAFAQGYGDRNDRGRNEQERGQQDRRDNDARQPNRRQDQRRTNIDERRGERGAGSPARRGRG